MEEAAQVPVEERLHIEALRLHGVRHVMASATGRFENCDHGGKDTEVSLAIGVHVPHTPSPLVRWVPPLQPGRHLQRDS